MTKRNGLLILFALLLVILSSASAVAQDDEQVLRIATGSSGSASFTFNILTTGGDQQNWITFLSVPPLYFDTEWTLKPGFFSAWEANEEGSVWTFTIDPRAQWSDGTPITAQQVIDSWQIQAAPVSNAGRIRSYLGNVVGFEEGRQAAGETGPSATISGLTAVDEATVQVELVNPDLIFHWRIATAHLAIARAEDVLEYGFADWWKPANNPVFNGPFLLTAFDENLLTAEMTPNPNWWMEEGPFLDRVTFQFVPDPQIIATMALNDEIDASLAALPATFRETLPDFFNPRQVIAVLYFFLAPSVEPTNDPKVREALLLSVDWNQVFQAAWPLPGTGAMTTQHLDPTLECWDPELTGYPYDPEAARAALAESSYGSAENLPVLRVTPRGASEILNRALQATVEFWRQNLGIENVDYQQDPANFGDDAALINVSRDDVVIRFRDSATYLWSLAHSAGPVVSGTMLTGYQNEEVDALLDEALLLPVDDARRCELTREAQALFAGDYVAAHFGKGVSTLNARAYVEGYMRGPDIALIEPWNIRINR